MKKTCLSIALTLAFAVSSHAAAILWSVDVGAIRNFTVDGTTITEGTSNLGGASLYFFIGSTTEEDVAKAFTGTTLDTSKLSTYLETATSTAGGSKVKGSTPVVNDLISSSKANNFFMVIAATQGEKAYYKLVEGSAVGYETTGDPLSPTTTMAFTKASVQNASWTAVPEPSTAMLALAGLALLIKRRRA